MTPDNVISRVVNRNLCCGCGICAGVCPSRVLTMGWNQFGELNPALSGVCSPSCSACMSVCPFAPGNPDEDELARDPLPDPGDMQHDTLLGYYRGTYAGHVASDALRESSSSGGLATWILETMLKSGAVNTVICVGPGKNTDRLFSSSAVTSPGDVRRASRSAYYPVDLSEALRQIITTPGRYAVTALPCMAKGIRLAALKRKIIRQRVIAIIGLTCGQMKSAHFTGYMAAYAGLSGHPRMVNFRGKDPERTADNFYFTFIGDNVTKKIFWLDGPSEAWSNRWFTLNACRFCDDIFAEVADVSLMDAWLPEYVTDPRGTNLVISRSPVIDDLLRNGFLRGEISLHDISPEQVIRSQHNVIEYKRRELAFRLYWSKSAVAGLKKRISPRSMMGLSSMVRSVIRDIMQKKSITLSNHYLNINGFNAAAFRKKMLPYLWALKTAERIIAIVDWPIRLLKEIISRFVQP